MSKKKSSHGGVVVVVVVWFILAIIEPPQLTLFNSVLDWVVAIGKAKRGGRGVGV